VDFIFSLPGGGDSVPRFLRGFILLQTALLRQPKRKLNLLQRQEERAGYLFILPNNQGIVMFIVLPVIFSLFLGFTHWNPMLGLRGISFVGLRNFARIPSDERVITSLLNNLRFSFTYVPITICLALILAGVMNHFVHCKVPLRMMCFMPYISSMVSVSVVWMLILYPETGPVSMFLSQILGIKNPPRWFVESKWALNGIALMSIWHDIGYFMIILVSGMQNISRELYEAADIDGAGPVKSFFRITVPMLVPTLFFCIILATITSFRVFDPVNVITKGGPGFSSSTLVYTMYFNGFLFYEFGYASAIAWLLFIIVFILSMVQLSLRKRLDPGDLR
jgi:ABC-type sugar transport system permease subunit